LHGALLISCKNTVAREATVSRKLQDCDMLTHASLFGEPFRELDEDTPVTRIPDLVESNDQP
jgi:hypothetical protein